MNALQRLGQQAKQFWLSLSLWRQIGLILATVLLVGGMSVVVYLVSLPDYRVLYSGLSLEDAQAIAAKLQEKGVSYRLSVGGTTVQVPADKLQQAKLDLAADGLPGKSDKGFGMFDEQSIGATPFNQHVNYLRALQAELAKTIMQVDPIMFARVHITRPEPSPFIREQKPTTASVLLKLKPGAALSRSAAAGIVALVAKSVEGLTPEQVTIMDTNGRVLSEQHPADGSGVVASHLDYRRQLETELESKAQEMLATALGPGHAIVRVTADVDFTTKMEMRETIDPEQKILKKTTSKTVNSSNTTPGSRGPAGTASNLRLQPSSGTSTPTTHKEEDSDEEYDYGKGMTKIEQGKGEIKRLTVAAMVDLSGLDASSGSAGSALKEEDIKKIIQNAVGFSARRGDQIEVKPAKLQTASDLTNLDTEWLEMQRWQNYLSIARQASLGVAALVALVLGFLFLRRLRPAAKEKAESQSGDETQARLAFASLAQRDPELVARVLSGWMAEPRQQQTRAAA